MLQYIHFNRHQNSLLINDLKKQIEVHHPLPPSPTPATTPAASPSPATTPTSPPTSSPPPPSAPIPGQVQILVRKEAGNPLNFFDKTYVEYEEGFASNDNGVKTTK